MLPDDIVFLISKMVTGFQDYLSLRLVCSSWCSATPPPSPPTSLPCLAVHRRDTKGRPAIFLFLALSGSHVHTTALAETPLGAMCRGSSYGWMALLGPQTLAVTLFHPSTRSRISLPFLLPSYEGVSLKGISNEELCRIGSRLLYMVVLSADPTETSDFMVMAMVGWKKRLAFCRPIDEGWTPIHSPAIQPRQVDLHVSQGRPLRCMRPYYLCLQSRASPCRASRDSVVRQRLRRRPKSTWNR